MQHATQIARDVGPSEGECTLRIGILGHYGTQNLGDEAIVAAAIGALRESGNTIQPVGISMNPADTAERHGITSVGLRRYSAGPKPEIRDNPPSGPANGWRSMLKRVPFLKPIWRFVSRLIRAIRNGVMELGHVAKVYRQVRHLDGVIIAGSGQFEDSWGGPLAFPYTLFKWSLMARLTGTPMFVLSVGAGPVDRALSRWLLRRCARWARYVSFRDEASATLMQFVSGRQFPVAPDLALGLEVDPSLRSGSIAGHIGVNVMPIYDARYWHTADGARYHAYIGIVATAVADLCKAGNRVTLIATQPKDLLSAVDLQAAVEQLLTHPVNLPTIYPETVGELLKLLSTCELLIASRLHALILASLVGTPAVGICKDEKQREFLRQVGTAGTAIPFEAANAESLAFEIHRARKRRRESKAELCKFVERSRAVVRAQFRDAVEEVRGCRSS